MLLISTYACQKLLETCVSGEYQSTNNIRMEIGQALKIRADEASTKIRQMAIEAVEEGTILSTLRGF